MSEHIATSNSIADIRPACAAATEDGAIVTIPGSGIVHWTEPLEWDLIPPNATLRSTGPLTIIDDYKSNRSLISLNTHKDGTFRMYGIQVFGGSAGDQPKYDGVIGIGGYSKDIRVHHFRINVQTYSPVLQNCALQFTGYVNACVDHGVIDLHSVGNGVRTFFPWYGGTMDDGSASWAAPTNFGSRDAVVLEKMVFNGNSRFSCINDCGSGGRMVIRRSRLNRAFIQTHPTRTGITRGARSMEIYLNDAEANEADPHSELFFHDAGTAMVWGNKAKGYKTFHLMRAPRRAPDPQHAEAPTPDGWGYAGTSFNGSGSNWDGNEDPVTGYPNLDMVGRGKGDKIIGEFPNKKNEATGCDASKPCAYPRQALEPVYSFLNDWTPVPNNPGGLIETADVIVEGRDYHRASVGTKAEMLAISTAKEGQGFWVEDEGDWNTGLDPELPKSVQGVLYAWKNNEWVLIYTPLRYPHDAIIADTDDVGGVSLPPEPVPVPVPIPEPNKPPSVRITWPLDGAVLQNKNVTITVLASDDTGVAWLELWINDQMVKQAATTTMSYSWNTSPYKGKGEVTIKAYARDADKELAQASIKVSVKK